MVFFSLCATNAERAMAAFSGAFDIGVDQRFFESSRLGSANDFDSWGTFEISTRAALFEMPYRLEPIVGLSYLRKSAPLKAVDSGGSPVVDAEGRTIVSNIDRLQVDLFSLSLGLRVTAWKADFFWIIPYAECLPTLRLGKMQKVTEAEGQIKSLSGLEMAFDMGGGLFFVVAEGNKRGSDLGDLWGLGSFGFLLNGHYSWGGLWKSGFGGVDSLGGAGFGGGLRADW